MADTEEPNSSFEDLTRILGFSLPALVGVIGVTWVLLGDKCCNEDDKADKSAALEALKKDGAAEPWLKGTLSKLEDGEDTPLATSYRTTLDEPEPETGSEPEESGTKKRSKKPKKDKKQKVQAPPTSSADA